MYVCKKHVLNWVVILEVYQSLGTEGNYAQLIAEEAGTSPSVPIAGQISRHAMLLVVMWQKYQDKCAWVTKQDFPPLISFHLGQMANVSESFGKLDLALVSSRRLYKAEVTARLKRELIRFPVAVLTGVTTGWLNLPRKQKQKSSTWTWALLRNPFLLALAFLTQEILLMNQVHILEGHDFARDWVMFSQVNDFPRNWVSS